MRVQILFQWLGFYLRENTICTMKRRFLWAEIMVAYIFWEDWQPGKDDPEKFGDFLFSDAGDFVPFSKIFLLSLLLLDFSSTSLGKKTKTKNIVLWSIV